MRESAKKYAEIYNVEKLWVIFNVQIFIQDYRMTYRIQIIGIDRVYSDVPNKRVVPNKRPVTK